MSYSILYWHGADGEMHRGAKFGNAWGGAAHIWSALVDFYGQSQVMIPGMREPLINHSASWGKLWELHTKNEELREGRVMAIPTNDWLPLLPWEHNVLVLSYDNAIVAGRENLELLARSLELFHEKHHTEGRIDHTKAMAEAIRGFTDADGVGLWATSVTESPWWVSTPEPEDPDEPWDDEGRAYNVQTDERHHVFELRPLE